MSPEFYNQFVSVCSQALTNDILDREAKKNMRENGDYCAAPPFGYKKNPKNKNKLIFSAPDNTGAWNLYSTHLLNRKNSAGSLTTD